MAEDHRGSKSSAAMLDVKAILQGQITSIAVRILPFGGSHFAIISLLKISTLKLQTPTYGSSNSN